MRAPFIYLRIAWQAANQFRAAVSHDGVVWEAYVAAITPTLTPTHAFLIVNTQGGSVSTHASFEYLRVTAADLVG